jgi:hypothetical protein
MGFKSSMTFAGWWVSRMGSNLGKLSASKIQDFGYSQNCLVRSFADM